MQRLAIGAGLTPIGDPEAVLDAARAADSLGFDAVALWDHYQSGQPEWAYSAGWAMWGAIAAVTTRVRLVPMVLNLAQHQLGRIAKETAILSLLSRDRFELGIGAGDWPESFAAWGLELEPFDVRRVRLEESVAALRALAAGGPVDAGGTHVRLTGAIVSPAPSAVPRIVVGVGESRRLAGEAARYADELNVYPESALVEAARESIAAAGRPVALSVHADWSWDRWPADPWTALDALRALAVDRAFIALGGPDTLGRLEVLARAR